MPRIYRRKKNYKKRRAQPSRAIISAVSKVMARKAELKDLTTTISDLNANSTAGVVIQKINPPAQGDGSNQRDGDQLYLKSVQLNAQMNCATDTVNTQRLIIFQWMEDDTSCTPAVGDILQNTTNAALPFSFYVTNPGRKFRVLYDKVFNFDGSGGSQALRVVNAKLNPPQKKMSFDPATITGVGNLYMLVCGIKAAGALNQINYRIRYYDN